MPGAAAMGDSVEGTHESTEEEGMTVEFTGTISGNCSSKVFISGKAAAYVGSTTTESDEECSGTGTVTTGSSKVFIEGHPAARNGDEIQGHMDGTGTITSGSSSVIFG